MKRLKEVDVAIIGMGWAGGIMAKELSDAGLNIVGFERGIQRSTEEHFTVPQVRDELKYHSRNELMQDTAKDTVSFRNSLKDEALPMRQIGSFALGEGVGGSGLHWNGQTYRFLETDFNLKSHIEKRYGRSYIPEHSTIQDWPVTYSELEKFYDKFEYLCGVSGRAGNLKGAKQEGGNPFEAARSRDYPNPPLKESYSNQLFREATKNLGYNPFPGPAANSSQAYRNPEGSMLGSCVYCGHCERFGCETNAKASPHITVIPQAMKRPNFELRTQSIVTRIVKDSDGKKATGVEYVDLKNGEVIFQPARIVILSAYALNNVHLMLLSKIGTPFDPTTGKGTIGKNYSYQLLFGAHAFFENKVMNPFMGAGGLMSVIDDFNGDNFDHSGLGFIGGGFMASASTGGRPIHYRPTPSGTPRWGHEWKKATAKWYNRSALILFHGSNYSTTQNYLDLDPTYRNSLNQPLLRMTYNFTENDKKMSAFMAEKLNEIGRAMGPTHLNLAKPITSDYSIVPYQTSHNTGGAIMGSSPKNSAINKFCQSWDLPNLFVIGASAFPQNTGYNPTGTIGALAYLSAEAIHNRYLKNEYQSLV